MAEILRYECWRPFSVPPRLAGHRERIGNLDVTEYRRRSKVRPYGLRIETLVSTEEEARERHGEALKLADDLNTVWAYVAGVPLFSNRLVLEFPKSPSGWRSNFKTLEGSLPTAQPMKILGYKISAGRYLMPLPYWPLQDALAAVLAYRSTNDSVRLLIGLHHGAMNESGSESGLFLFAKALELARVMLPGLNDNQRQAALSTDVRHELRQSLHWLYGIANERLEIRHVVNRKRTGLLPRLKANERTDFMKDSDLVIRGVVERELRIRLVIVR
jgi:signal transduction histidine kinase